MLNRYGPVAASSRLRSFQFAPWFEREGIECTFQALFNDSAVTRRYAEGAYGVSCLVRAYAERVGALLTRRQFDLVWIEKEALPWMPTTIERLLLSGVPYVLDFDDAVFHNYDLHPSVFVRRFFGARIDRLMNRASLVIAGNEYLAQRARDAGCSRVEVIPTVIDLNRYPPKRSIADDDTVCRIVWIGSPSTSKYLQLLEAPFKALSNTHTFKLRVIGGGGFASSSADIEEIKWSEDTEVDLLHSCDIGVMPLVDGCWERGKCGYKLIQYMACGLPVVGSAVGVNSQIIVQGINGYVARSSEDWVRYLATLLGDASLRFRMGLSGRERVERLYCAQQVAPKLIDLLRGLKLSL